MSELLPCPFCGGSSVLHNDLGGDQVWCANTTCEAVGPVSIDGPEHAITGWNTRVTDTRISDLERALEQSRDEVPTAVMERYLAMVRRVEVLEAALRPFVTGDTSYIRASSYLCNANIEVARAALAHQKNGDES